MSLKASVEELFSRVGVRTFVAFKISHFILHFEAVSRISHCDASRKGIALAPHFGGHNRHLSLCHRYIERKKRVRERIGHL